MMHRTPLFLLAGLLPLILSACESPHGIGRSVETRQQDGIVASELRQEIGDLKGPAYRGVTLAVWEGKALILGAVSRPDQKRAVEAIALQQDGVTEVFNELVLMEDKKLDTYARDRGLEAKVEAHLGNSNSNGIIVRVSNGVCFLMGRVRHQNDADALILRARDTTGIKWVVPHLFINSQS